MALIKCKECNNSVSTKAEKCPHCGIPIKVKPRQYSCCSLILLILFVTIAAPIILPILIGSNNLNNEQINTINSGVNDELIGEGDGTHNTEARRTITKPKLDNNFVFSYEIQKEKYFSIYNAKRIGVWAFVPYDLSKDEIEDNIYHLLNKTYRSEKPDAILIAILTHDQEIGDAPWNVASAYWAPNGEWSEAKENTPLSKFKIRIEYNSIYFDKKYLPDFQIGQNVNAKAIQLVKEKAEIKIFSEALVFPDESKVIDILPDKQVVEIIDYYYEFGIPEYIYKVYKIQYPKGNIFMQGWVMDYNLQGSTTDPAE